MSGCAPRRPGAKAHFFLPQRPKARGPPGRQVLNATLLGIEQLRSWARSARLVAAISHRVRAKKAEEIYDVGQQKVQNP